MLTAPRGMMRLTRSGPFHDNARDVAGLIEDPARTAIVLVSLPEELPVSETTELYGRLGLFQAQVAGIILNGVNVTALPENFGALRPALLASANPAGREAIALADLLVRRRETQDRARANLQRLGPPVVDLPDLEAPAMGSDELDRLATCLGAYT